MVESTFIVNGMAKRFF